MFKLKMDSILDCDKASRLHQLAWFRCSVEANRRSCASAMEISVTLHPLIISLFQVDDKQANKPKNNCMTKAN